MSGYVVNEIADPPPWRLRPGAVCAAGLARGLARLTPTRLRRVLEYARRGARPATEAEAARARNAVVAMSRRCTGQWCLQRSIATALLCRMSGTWPDWRTGVKIQPFRAHAWVEAEGRPVGEDADQVRSYHVVMSVPCR